MANLKYKLAVAAKSASWGNIFQQFWNQLHDQNVTPNPITFKIAIKEYFLNLDNVPDN